jgi:hypothetical protein
VFLLVRSAPSARRTRSRLGRPAVPSTIPVRSRTVDGSAPGRTEGGVRYYDVKTSRVMLELTSGVVFGFPPRVIPGLAKASPGQLARVELSPGGSGLHWEELDLDLSVAGLLLSSIGRRERLSELARLAGRSPVPQRRPPRGRTGQRVEGRGRKPADSLSGRQPTVCSCLACDGDLYGRVVMRTLLIWRMRWRRRVSRRRHRRFPRPIASTAATTCFDHIR